MLHKNYRNCLILVSLFFLSVASQASVEEFQTTRLKATAGAGVASILMDEATVLNPAPIAFFNLSSLYFQRSGANFDTEADSNPFSSHKADSTAFIISDSKGSISGSASYISQNEGHNERKRFSFSTSTTVGEKSAFGIAYRVNKNKISTNGIDYHEESIKQFTLGIIHAISPSLTLGMVAFDPLKAVPEETRGIVGLQYVYNNFITLMADIGADYNNDLKETFLYRAAMQFKVYDDFFLRFGTHDDKGTGERGTGVGLGWVQPRLVLEVAMRNTERKYAVAETNFQQKAKDSSFSISYRF